MAAGDSQLVLAVQAALASTKESKRAPRPRQSERHVAGCRGERVVCSALSTLALQGFHHLDDRSCRDRPERVNLDHLVVGPTGVFVVDAKNWAGRIAVRDGQLTQDGVSRNDRMIAVGWLTRRVQDVLDSHGVRARSVVCFAAPQPHLPADLRGLVLLTDPVRLAARLAGEPRVLSVGQVEALVELLAHAFPPYDVDPQAVLEAQGLLFGEEQARHAGMDTALQTPIEDWTGWLHPEQRSASRRSFAGPARVSGSAGTGKTSVGLHRVAHLAARRPGRFLVTSYVRSLPPTLATAYARLSPATVDRVDFRHVHAVARQVLHERGRGVPSGLGSTAFALAWRSHREALAGTDLSQTYFREEVDSVIKGRDLPSLEAYLQLERVGRRVPLREEVRREVWALAQRYDEELARRGEVDQVDVLRLARDEVRNRPYERWTGVVVDEVQDVPLVGLQLLHELAGRDRPDGLLMIGDGQQAVYPGGFRLAEAGISVAGRGVVLRANYRNTVEILATARAVVAQDAHDDLDLDLEHEPGERPVEVVRHGELPSTGRYADLAEHDAALLWDLQARLDRGARPSDIAVLCSTNDLVARYADLLVRSGVPVALVAEPGPLPDGVRMATWFRCKGMEFGHVLVPQVDRRTRLLTGAGRAAEAEKGELLRRTLYVAMTRARDALWTGSVGAGPISRIAD
ncbi:MAG TPA: UvrD-helicase domain-containing protein [Mycobacteriales bacterium]|jgi:hypothetical protein|nr:UvrD-helicase domain-containing protein [Mycobacteriales bacterium]